MRIAAAARAVALADGWATHAISILDPAQDALRLEVPRCLVLRFEDVESPCPEGPTAEHVRQALDFARELGAEDRLLVHCVAGLSRSTAIAVAILVQHGAPADIALAHVAGLRPNMMPNERICRYADEALDTGGSIMMAVRAWQAEQIAAFEASREDRARR